MARTAIGYVRVSTHEQAVSGLGLEAQERAVRAYCEMRGMELVEIVRDEGVSAGKALVERPGGSEVHRATVRRNRRVDHVVALKLDRLFRDAGEALDVVKGWQRAGVSLHLVDQGGASIDTDTAMGTFMLTMLAAVAEMERNLCRERTTAALGAKRARGEKTGGTVPYGYDARPDKANGTIQLVPNAQEQAVIQRMHRERGTGATLRAIAESLNGDGVPTKTGRAWAAETVRAILSRDAR